MLRRWRTAKGLDLEEGAKVLGLPVSTLSDIERGVYFPTATVIAKIEGATGSAVTAADHFLAWQLANPEEFSKSLAAGRSAAKSHIPPAKLKENQQHGGKSRRK